MILGFQLPSIRFPSGLLFSQMFRTLLIEAGRVGAIHFEPPFADEIRLLENGAVGTKEGDLPAVIADVKDLETESRESAKI